MKYIVLIVTFWSLFMINAQSEGLYLIAEGEEDGKPLIFRSLLTFPKVPKNLTIPT